MCWTTVISSSVQGSFHCCVVVCALFKDLNLCSLWGKPKEVILKNRIIVNMLLLLKYSTIIWKYKLKANNITMATIKKVPLYSMNKKVHSFSFYSHHLSENVVITTTPPIGSATWFCPLRKIKMDKVSILAPKPMLFCGRQQTEGWTFCIFFWQTTVLDNNNSFSTTVLDDYVGI